MFSEEDLIYSYTRREALQDGVLVSLMKEMELPAFAGIHVACTTAFFDLFLHKVWGVDPYIARKLLYYNLGEETFVIGTVDCKCVRCIEPARS